LVGVIKDWIALQQLTSYKLLCIGWSNKGLECITTINKL